MKIIYSLSYLLLALIAFIGFFQILDILTKKYYKPSVSYVRDVFHVTCRGDIDYGLYDEFTCVPIHYYPELEAIRLKYVEIVESSEMLDELKEGQELNLNEAGKQHLEALILQLDKLPEIIPNPNPDSFL